MLFYKCARRQWRTAWTEVLRGEMPRFREDSPRKGGISLTLPAPHEGLSPGEPFKLRVRDLVPGVAAAWSSNHFSIILHPSECEVPSKTQEFDETVQIDLPGDAFLGQALIIHLRLRERDLAGQSNDRAFTRTAAQVQAFQWLQSFGPSALYLYGDSSGGTQAIMTAPPQLTLSTDTLN